MKGARLPRIAVAQSLRWIALLLLHSGNHLCIRDHTSLGSPFELEAEDSARALPMDVREAMKEGLGQFWEVAEPFGVPDEMVLLQAPMRMK